MSKRIGRMFSDIHRDYDRMNHILSMGIDKSWRKAAAREAIIAKKSYNILDVASGTGDFTIALEKAAREAGKKVRIIGMNFNRDMLKVGNEKITKKKVKNIHLEFGNALSTKYKRASFDVVTSAFALRDFDNLGKFLKEVNRMLKNGGKFVFLEMALPDNKAGRAFFRHYFRLLRKVGATVDKNAYNFLFDSIMEFDKDGLVKKVRLTGFENIKVRNLTSGIGFFISGEKRMP